MHDMPGTSPNKHHHGVSKFFHWGVAGLIFGALFLGFFMVSLDFSPFKLALYTVHKSIGMTILFLAGLRILWRSFTRTPAALDTHAAWEKALSKFIHVLLYLGMIGIPLSGWLMSSAAEFANSYFWLFEFPALMGKDEAWFEILKAVHEYAALALMAGVGLHMAGALKHHFIDRDTTLKRMTHERLGFIGAGFIAVLGFSVLGASAALYVKAEGWLDVLFASQTSVSAAEISAQLVAQKQEDVALQDGAWAILADQSTLDFTAQQYGTAFEGRFERFGGLIIFDPQDLANAYARIEIDVRSIKTGASDRDAQATGEPWFFAERFPMAVFEADRFSEHESGAYIAHGRLTIRDIRQDIALPFTLEVTEKDDGALLAVWTQICHLIVRTLA